MKKMLLLLIACSSISLMGMEKQIIQTNGNNLNASGAPSNQSSCCTKKHLALASCSIPLLVTGLLDTVSLIIVRGLCGACAPDEDTDREINDNTYCCTRNLLHCIGIEKCCGMNTEIRDDSNVVYIID